MLLVIKFKEYVILLTDMYLPRNQAMVMLKWDMILFNRVIKVE